MNPDSQSLESKVATHVLPYPFNWKLTDRTIFERAGVRIPDTVMEKEQCSFSIISEPGIVSPSPKGVVFIEVDDLSPEGLLKSLLGLCTEVDNSEAKPSQSPARQPIKRDANSSKPQKRWSSSNSKLNSTKVSSEPLLFSKILVSALIFFSFSKILKTKYKGSGPLSSRGKLNQLEPILKYLITNSKVRSMELDQEYNENRNYQSTLSLLSNESLRALATFLFDRSSLFSKSFIELSETLIPQVKKLLPQPIQGVERSSRIIRPLNLIGPRLALNCINSVCYKVGFRHDSQLLSQYFKLAYEILKQWSQPSKTFSSKKERVKILKSTLCILQTIIKEDKRVFKEDLKEFLLLLFEFLPYDFLTFSQDSSYLTNESGGISSEQNYCLSASDTEFMATSNSSGRTINYREILRCLSLKTLRLLVESYRSQSLVMWDNLLPRENFRDERTLLHVILNDPLPTVRWYALDVLTELLNGSSKYLEMAIVREVAKTSFSTLSDKLGATVVQIHLGVAEAILNEETKEGILHLLKVTEILLQHCCYKQLGDTHVYEILKSIGRVLLTHSDHMIQTAGWKTSHILLESDVSDPFKKRILGDDTIMPDGNSMVAGAKDLICSERLYSLLRAESISFMTTLINFEMISWFQITSIADRHIFDPNHQVRVAVLKLIIAFAKHFQLHKDQESAAEFWTIVLDDFLSPLSADESPEVRAVVCNGLEILGATVFEQLKNRRQLFGITLLLGYTEDVNSEVGAIAFGALGQFVRFQILQEDLQFLIDVASLSCKGIDATSIDVKVRASWCLANTCDVLFFIRNELPRDILLFDEALLLKIFRSGVTACEGHDKIKWNGVRVLGGLIGSGLTSLLNIDTPDLFREAGLAIQRNISSGPLKARWNACHALKNMHENPHFPPRPPLPDWYSELMETVLVAIDHCKNFKVKVSGLVLIANLPLGILPEPQKVLRRLMELIDKLEEIEGKLEFREVALFESFVDQLLATYDTIRNQVTIITVIEEDELVHWEVNSPLSRWRQSRKSPPTEGHEID